MNTPPAGSNNPELPAPALEPWEQAERAFIYRVTYTYETRGATYSTEGLSRDFSRSGCGIRGTIIPPVGSKIGVTLHFGQNLDVSTTATITWVAGEFFGVGFHEMNKKDYVRIRQYIRNARKRSAGARQCSLTEGIGTP